MPMRGGRDPPAGVEAPAADQRLAGADDEPGDRAADQRRQGAVDAAATAVPASPASGKTRNPAVQISQVRRNDVRDVRTGHGAQLLGPAVVVVGSGCAPRGVVAASAGSGCGRGGVRRVTPRAATHSPQPVLPSRPARSQTGKPGTAVARMSPWLSR